MARRLACDACSSSVSASSTTDRSSAASNWWFARSPSLSRLVSRVFVPPTAPCSRDRMHRPRGAVTLIGALATSIIRRIVWRDQWRIVLFRGQPRNRLGTAVGHAEADARAFWADPFLVVRDDWISVFFEELPFASGKGRISHIGIDHNGNCAAPVVVLERSWHLSYPFVFEWTGRFYMIPESSANETVDLYECVGFPLQWRFVQTIIRGQRLADASIVSWQGRLWMFAAHGQRRQQLRRAAHPLGPRSSGSVASPCTESGEDRRGFGSSRRSHVGRKRPNRSTRAGLPQSVWRRSRLSGGPALDERQFEERPLHRLSVAETAPGDAIHTFNAAKNYAAVDAARSCLRIAWPLSLSLRKTGAAARAIASAQTTSSQVMPQKTRIRCAPESSDNKTNRTSRGQ